MFGLNGKSRNGNGSHARWEWLKGDLLRDIIGITEFVDVRKGSMECLSKAEGVLIDQNFVLQKGQCDPRDRWA
jgi:hypothetical protein